MCDPRKNFLSFCGRLVIFCWFFIPGCAVSYLAVTNDTYHYNGHLNSWIVGDIFFGFIGGMAAAAATAMFLVAIGWVFFGGECDDKGHDGTKKG